MKLDVLPSNVAAQLSSAYLKTQNRSITETQHSLFMDSVANVHPSALLMKLWLDDAIQWKSYTPLSSIHLEQTVNEAIVCMFRKLEVTYGALFVSAALGYVTVGRQGISSVEMDDVLSCNDDVLNEVYKYHDPPLDGIIRIPPLLWARVYEHLREYFVEKEVFTKSVITWYHRQFIETAQKRYAEGKVAKKLHRDLVEIYTCTDKVRKTIALRYRERTIENADRQVTPQLMQENNWRMLVSRPYHLFKSMDMDSIKTHYLGNLQFVRCLMAGVPLKNYVHDGLAALQEMEEVDGEATLLYECLRFSRNQICNDIHSLPTQLMGQLLPHISVYPYVEKLVNEASLDMDTCGKTMLKPVIGCIRTSSSGLKWYMDGPVKIVAQNIKSNLLLVAYINGKKGSPFCKVIDLVTISMIQTLPCFGGLADETIKQGGFSRNSQRAYLLCNNHFVVFSVTNDLADAANLQIESTVLLDGKNFNAYMAVGSREKRMFLATHNELAVLEDDSTLYMLPHFHVARTVIVKNSTATTNALFCGNNSMVISTHTIKTSKGSLTGVVLGWPWRDDKIKTTTILAAPVSEGFLYILEKFGDGNTVLCGCIDRQLYIVNAFDGSIIQHFGTPDESSTFNLLTSYDMLSNTIVLAHKGGNRISVWDITKYERINVFYTKGKLTDVQIGPEDNHVVAVSEEGDVSVFNYSDGEVVNRKGHSDRITSVVCFQDDQIITAGKLYF